MKENDHVVLNCGFLKDGYIPVTATISYSTFSWPDGQMPSVFIQFSNSSDYYVVNAHRLVDAILLLSGE